MPHHMHHHHQHEARQDNDVKFVEETVFVTAAKTFDGPIAGWSTASDPMPTQEAAQFLDNSSNDSTSVAPAPVVSQTPSPSPQQSSDDSNNLASSAAPVVTPSSSVKTSALPSTIQTKAQPSPSGVASSIEVASSSVNPYLQPPYNTDVSTAPAPTAAGSDQPASADTGMTSGAKAGLAIGLLALAALLAAVGFFFYRRKQTKAARGQKLDDEKSSFNNQQAATGLVPRVSVKRSKGGPRLSLRPVTQMFPPEMSEKQAAAVASAGGLAAPAAAVTRSKSPEVTNEKSNPFGDHAKLPEVEDPSLAPKPLNISRPSTPTGAPRLDAAAPASPSVLAAGAKAPGTPNGTAGPLNVHRVQLDFAPSMDDELELRQGQLVRMLHEYDDGWALCIRLDRSQQGVVPRSCISKLPVKPRPAPGPGAPGQQRRGPPPASAGGRSQPGTPRMRSASNAPSANGRPASPANSQGPFGEGSYRARSNTDSTAQTSNGKKEYAPSTLSNSPSNSPATSPKLASGEMPARKPVPGQAV